MASSKQPELVAETLLKYHADLEIYGILRTYGPDTNSEWSLLELTFSAKICKMHICNQNHVHSLPTLVSGDDHRAWVRARVLLFTGDLSVLHPCDRDEGKRAWRDAINRWHFGCNTHCNLQGLKLFVTCLLEKLQPFLFDLPAFGRQMTQGPISTTIQLTKLFNRFSRMSSQSGQLWTRL